MGWCSVLYSRLCILSRVLISPADKTILGTMGISCEFGHELMDNRDGAIVFLLLLGYFSDILLKRCPSAIRPSTLP
jgi:hypothetical protein